LNDLLSQLSSYPDDVKLKAIRQALARQFKSSLYHTSKYLLSYKDVNLFTHGRMIRALEAPTLRKLIVMPRGTFKSSVGIVSYAVWLLINNPDLRILIDSEKYDNSKNFIGEIKAKLQDPLCTGLFGDFRGPRDWTEGSFTIAQRKRIFKESSVTASGIGAGKTGQHYDVIIHDDMNTKDNSQTPERRKKIIDHVKLNTAILDPGGIMVYIGTRYAADDVIGWAIENGIGKDFERFRVA
jgi:hypothetical protein